MLCIATAALYKKHLALWEIGILTGEAQVEHDALNEVRKDSVNAELQ
jgi:hypothetical protein